MTSRKRVLLADGSEEFRWLMWKNVANHNFFSLATVGSGRDVYYVCKNRLPICC